MVSTAVLNSAPVAQPAKNRVKRGAIRVAYTAIAVAMGESLTMNIWADTRGQTTDWVAVFVAVIASIAAPLLIMLVSHVFAELQFHWLVTTLMGLTVAALMYVSASAGTKALEPTKGFGPALSLSLGVDAIAALMLIVLMEAAEREAAWQKWEAGEADRARAAAAAAAAQRKQAEREELELRFGRRGTRQGNGGNGSGGNAEGNGEQPLEGNSVPVPKGNVQRPAGMVPASGAPSAAAGAKATAAGARVVAVGETAGRESGGTVVDFQARRVPAPAAGRKPSMSEDEMYRAAWKLAEDLDKIGQVLSNARFAQEYGGKTERFSPVVKQVKADFAAKKEAAQARESGEDADDGHAAGLVR
jgi:hypothetical protein